MALKRNKFSAPALFLIGSLVLSSTPSIAANTSVHKEIPQGHTYTEKEELWHLSEGADFFPLRWFLHVDSVFRSQKITEPSKLYSNLNEKFGVVEVDDFDHSYAGDAAWNSPMKWVGLTLASSEPVSEIPKEGPFQITNDIGSDEKPDSDEKAYEVLSVVDSRGAQGVSANSLYKGQVQIPMVGTNCALCHSNLMLFKEKGVGQNFQSAFIEGAPNMLNVREFFKDMGASTIKTMIDEDLLAQYLLDLEKKNLIDLTSDQTWKSQTAEEIAKETAVEFVESFKTALLGVPNSKWFDEEMDVQGVKGILAGIFMKANNQVGSIQEGVFRRAVSNRVGMRLENRKVFAEYLGRFLALSYGIPYEMVKKTPSLKKRMEWLAIVITPDPDLASTPEGYGRTDAFGRISNMVARGPVELPLIAPVSFPPMWGMKYSNLFHFNGNTNSVNMRNIGQSFGLGALVFGESEGLSTEGGPLVTSNLYNLNRLEKHLYNIKYPEWNTLVPDSLKVDTNNPEHRQQVQKGCNVYIKKCMGCHDTGKRVGPGGAGQLVKHEVFTMQQAGTDPNHNIIQWTPVKGKNNRNIPFRQALFDLTDKVKNRYMTEMNVNSERMARWGNYDIRGQESFRDTFLGEIFGIEMPANYTLPFEVDYMDLVNEKTGDVEDKKWGYIAKSLAGVWATAPYLHNGSVPNLDQFLNPSTRPDEFYVGCRVYDPEKLGYIWSKNEYEQFGCEASERFFFDVNYKITQSLFINGQRKPLQKFGPQSFSRDGQFIGGFSNGNSNLGHSFDQYSALIQDGSGSSTLSQVVPKKSERKALLTFLKVLRPSAEYSWTSEAPYEISEDGQSCQAHAVPLPENTY